MSSNNELVRDREFKLVDFLMTHGQILFRSAKDAEQGLPCNVDVAFQEVDYLEVSFLSFKFSFVEATDEEIARVEKRIGRKLYPHTQVYVLQSEDVRFLVVAGEVRVQRNELTLGESSLIHWGDAC